MQDQETKEQAEFLNWCNNKTKDDGERTKWVMRSMVGAGMLVTGDVLNLRISNPERTETREGRYEIRVLPGNQCSECVGWRILFKRAGVVSDWEFLEGDVVAFRLHESVVGRKGLVFGVNAGESW
jgi:hypothetical protein